MFDLQLVTKSQKLIQSMRINLIKCKKAYVYSLKIWKCIRATLIKIYNIRDIGWKLSQNLIKKKAVKDV